VSAQTWQETLAWAVGDGTALANTVTPTSIIPAAAKFTLPAGFVNFVGKTFRVTAKGRMSNIVTTPGTLTLDVRLGGTVIFNGGAMQLNAVAKTNVTWWFEAEIVCRTVGNGSASNFLGIGQFVSEALVGAGTGAAGSTTNGSLNLPATAPAVGNNVDLSAALAVDLFGTFSIANAGNSIQVHTYKLESLN
jgi:hypothetical protein